MKNQFTKILRITITWTLISMIQYAIGLATLIDMDYDFSTKDPMIPFWGSIFTGMLAGILGGSMMVFGWEKWLRSKPYSVALRNIILSYLIIFLAVAIPSSCYFNMSFAGYSLFELRLWEEVLIALTGPTVLVPFFFWLIIVIITMITFLVDDKYGPGVFRKFLLGKYFTPSREERIFMFLDLKSSTTIAEKLGEETYFNFIRDTFKKITPAIIKNKAEVYQYVGDEIVLSWPLDRGIEKNKCIDCFFDCQSLLKKAEDYFQEKYRVTPHFKAGLHYGHVMAGEVGVIKREIAYSGDVLNTTARIQEMCNKLKANVLLSESLSKKLVLQKVYQIQNKGEIPLRGKVHGVTLIEVIKAEN